MYYLVYGFLYVVSLLPMWALYLISDFVAWLLFDVFNYRYWVIRMNLNLAFPRKTQKERDEIAYRFARNFTDTFMETIKLFSASDAFIRERMPGDYHVFEDLYKKGLKCQVHMGHNFNWELGNLSFSLNSSYQMLGVYMPLKNKTMDRIFRKLRSRTGTILLPATDMRKSIMPYRDQQYLLGLVADQVPPRPERAFWMDFLGMPTGFIPGPEKGARAGNIPVVFVNITKEKRGYYYLHATLVTEDPARWPEGELTIQYRDFLQRVIRQHPDMWLWSHRRWKKPWKAEYIAQWIDLLPPPQRGINPYVSNKFV